MEIRPARKMILYFLFALSGFCALVYEVLWTKYLSLSFGTTMVAVSIVTATFMGGLALGSYLLGRHADRETNLLRLYALLEGGIALFALLFPPTLSLLTNVHVFIERLAPAHPAIAHSIHFVFAIVLLLPPAVCMGGTFPLMCRFFARKKSGGQIGRLYALNTLGAMAGTLLAGYLLIPALGLAATGIFAATINLAIAVAAFRMAKAIGDTRPADVSRASRPDQPLQARQHRLTLVAIGLIGFFSLAYEILWTRVFLLFLGNTTYAFSLMLSAFLVGIALGGAIYARVVKPELNERSIFVVLSSLMGLSILATAPFYDRLAHLFQYAHQSSGEQWWQLSLLSFLIVFAAMCVPTTLSGALLPAAVAILDPGKNRTGEGVGLVVLHNTVGSMLGSLVAGFALIPAFGLLASFRLLAALNLILALALFIRFRPTGWLRPALPAMVLAGLALAVAPLSWNQVLMNSAVYCYAPKYAKWGGVEKSLQGERILQVIEGAETTVAVKEYVTGEVRYFTVNGKTDGGTGTDMETQLLIGQLPLLLHPNPRDALVIGLGTGITLGGVKEHPLQSIDCVEISPEVVTASQYFTKENRNALADPRVNLYVEDGRDLLLVKTKEYDVLVSQPSNPWQTGNANLFTSDFYELAAKRLKKEGVFCQWIGLYDITPENLKIVCRTFQQTFPHVLVFNSKTDLILVGAKDELTLNYMQLQKKMTQPQVKDLLSALDLKTPAQLLANYYLFSEDTLSSFSGDARVNTDNQPVLEYSFKDNLGGKMVFGDFVQQNAKAFASAHTGEIANVVNLGENPQEIAQVLIRLGLAHQEKGRTREANFFFKKTSQAGETQPSLSKNAASNFQGGKES